MFRWLLIVLLFALPAQFVSAAVSGYCGHESTSASFHVGHHAHQHLNVEQADTAQGQSDQSAVQDHGDCSACHIHAAQIGVFESWALGAIEQRSFVGMPIKLFSSRIDQDIDRPKWSRAG